MLDKSEIESKIHEVLDLCYSILNDLNPMNEKKIQFTNVKNSIQLADLYRMIKTQLRWDSVLMKKQKMPEQFYKLRIIAKIDNVISEHSKLKNMPELILLKDIAIDKLSNVHHEIYLNNWMKHISFKPLVDKIIFFEFLSLRATKDKFVKDINHWHLNLNNSDFYLVEF